MFDAHHHLWDTAVRDQVWMDGLWADPIRGRFDAARYARAAEPHGVTGSIVVQALSSTEETRELLAVADGPGPVAGVVGWFGGRVAPTGSSNASLAG